MKTEIKTVKDLKNAMADRTTKQVEDSDVCWFIAIQEARSLIDYTIKDLAEMLLSGTKPTTIDDAKEWLDNLWGDQPEEAMDLIEEALEYFYG